MTECCVAGLWTEHLATPHAVLALPYQCKIVLLNDVLLANAVRRIMERVLDRRSKAGRQTGLPLTISQQCCQAW